MMKNYLHKTSQLVRALNHANLDFAAIEMKLGLVREVSAASQKKTSPRKNFRD